MNVKDKSLNQAGRWPLLNKRKPLKRMSDQNALRGSTAEVALRSAPLRIATDKRVVVKMLPSDLKFKSR